MLTIYLVFILTKRRWAIDLPEDLLVMETVDLADGILRVVLVVDMEARRSIYFRYFGLEHGPFHDQVESIKSFNLVLRQLRMSLEVKKFMRRQFRKLMTL